MNSDEIMKLNELPSEKAAEQFRKCCGAKNWIGMMVNKRPYADIAQINQAADRAFDELERTDWIEAFECHPRIGDIESLRMKFAGNKQWSAGEQSGVSAASDEVLHRLAKGNDDYFNRFGYLFIVCATGKSAAEMLELLEGRLHNDPEEELILAGNEQRKITHLRIDKLSLED